MLNKRIGSLLFLSLLFVNLLFFISFTVKATDNNYWNLDFNSDIHSYSMPNGYTTEIRKAHFITQGYHVFNNSDCRMEGVFKPPDNIINYTLTIRFYHRKYKDNAGTQLADSEQLLFRLGTYTLLGSHDKEFLTIMIGDANTDSPYLQMRIETYAIQAGSGGVLYSYASKQLAGGFSNLVWHTLAITYCFPNQKIYVYFDNLYWTSESLERTGSYIWPSNYQLNLDIGAWKFGVLYSNWFSGNIDYISWESIYTLSYQATQNILWYHFDEYTGNIITDSSGNNYNGILDTTIYQRLSNDYGKFGYCIGGTNTYTTRFAVNITNEPVLITDKFTSSYYIYIDASGSADQAEGPAVNLKTFQIKMRCYGAASQYYFKLFCNIGGVDRTLQSTTFNKNSITSKWIYVYTRYDGSTLMFTIINSNNNTVLYNSTVSYSGIIAAQSKSPCSYYGIALKPNSYSMRYDELKLTRQMLGPYEMNSSSFGPPQNITVITPVSEDYWLEGYLNPDTYYLTPSNPSATGTLMINSSGDFTLRMKSGYTDLYNIFDIYGFNATSTSMPASVYYKTIRITMKNNTPTGTYYGAVNVTNSHGIPQSKFFGFTIIVSREGEFQNRTTPFDVIVMLSPLDLIWDDTKSGQIIIIIGGFNNQTAPLCKYQSEGFDMAMPKWDNYKNIFDENDYVEDLRDNLNHQYFRITYSIDARILDYGNLTIYHYVRIYQKDNPEIYTIRELTINIYIEAPLGKTDKLWVTVTQNSVTGKAGEIKQVTLNVYSNKKKYVYWTPSQSYDSIRPEYVFVTGDNYEYTNYTVILSVRIPQSCDTPRIVTMRVFEVYNPILNNYTILTVNGIPTGADFDFSLIPLEGYLDTVNQKCIFRGYITNKAGNIDSYFLNAKLNATFLNIQVGGTSNKPWYVGKDKELVFDIHVIYMELGKNGTYQIQFTAYTYNISNYVSKSVLIYISGSGLIPTIPSTTEPTITGTNLTLINIGNLIPVVGLGKGAVNGMFVAFSEISGLPISLSSFLIGLIFIIIALIGTAIISKGLAPTGTYVLIGLGMVVFNTMAGIWDMWILMIFVMFGILMLSFKVIGHISGNKESETR